MTTSSWVVGPESHAPAWQRRPHATRRNCRTINRQCTCGTNQPKQFYNKTIRILTNKPMSTNPQKDLDALIKTLTISANEVLRMVENGLPGHSASQIQNRDKTLSPLPQRSIRPVIASTPPNTRSLPFHLAGPMPYPAFSHSALSKNLGSSYLTSEMRNSMDRGVYALLLFRSGNPTIPRFPPPKRRSMWARPFLRLLLLKQHPTKARQFGNDSRSIARASWQVVWIQPTFAIAMLSFKVAWRVRSRTS